MTAPSAKARLRQCPQAPALNGRPPIAAPELARCLTRPRLPRPFLHSEMTLEIRVARQFYHTREKRPLLSLFRAVNEQRAFGLECSQLIRIAKPAARVDFRR